MYIAWPLLGGFVLLAFLCYLCMELKMEKK